MMLLRCCYLSAGRHALVERPRFPRSCMGASSQPRINKAEPQEPPCLARGVAEVPPGGSSRHDAQRQDPEGKKAGCFVHLEMF